MISDDQHEHHLKTCEKKCKFSNPIPSLPNQNSGACTTVCVQVLPGDSDTWSRVRTTGLVSHPLVTSALYEHKTHSLWCVFWVWRHFPTLSIFLRRLAQGVLASMGTRDRSRQIMRTRKGRGKGKSQLINGEQRRGAKGGAHGGACFCSPKRLCTFCQSSTLESNTHLFSTASVISNPF